MVIKKLNFSHLDCLIVLSMIFLNSLATGLCSRKESHFKELKIDASKTTLQSTFTVQGNLNSLILCVRRMMNSVCQNLINRGVYFA